MVKRSSAGRHIPLPGIALACAVTSGAVWLHNAGAPAPYAWVNLAALVAGLVLAVAIRIIPATAALPTALALAPLAVIATFGADAGLEGVHRWVSFGDLKLHALMLAGPPFAVAIDRIGGRAATVAVAIVSLGVALQPDLATAIALMAALASNAAFKRRRADWVCLGLALVAAVFALLHPDGLSPVPFVEGVIARLLGEGNILALACLAALMFAVLAPVVRSSDRRAGGRTVAGWYAGLVAASIVWPFPTPLIGYGAAPILGYAAALGLMGRQRR